MDFATARRKMVDNQVRPNDVTDPRLVAAMLEIPRERFVSADMAAMAYVDGDLLIDQGGQGRGGRFLLNPMMLARLIQAADVKDADCVLDVACGTGYSSAVLARLAGSVVALEERPDLADWAARLLKESGVVNAKVVNGPFNAGWSAEAPYDVILINGAVEYVPEALLAQVKEGGRLVTVVGGAPIGKAMLYQRASCDVSGRPIFDATAPVLPSFAKPKAFVF
jgi:protein-L-isoaspartate(D-aspartate) O-methyltransferase